MQFFNITKDLVHRIMTGAYLISHQIFSCDFNERQRVSAAPRNIHATYGAAIRTIKDEMKLKGTA
jgi:hypothetical protein